MTRATWAVVDDSVVVTPKTPIRGTVSVRTEEKALEIARAEFGDDVQIVRRTHAGRVRRPTPKPKPSLTRTVGYAPHVTVTEPEPPPNMTAVIPSRFRVITDTRGAPPRGCRCCDTGRMISEQRRMSETRNRRARQSVASRPCES